MGGYTDSMCYQLTRLLTPEVADNGGQGYGWIAYTLPEQYNMDNYEF